MIAHGGWARAAAVVLVLSMPIVAYFSYAIGSYDSRPWWEAISGAIMVVALALCLLMAAASRRAPMREDAPLRSLADPLAQCHERTDWGLRETRSVLRGASLTVRCAATATAGPDRSTAMRQAASSAACRVAPRLP